MALPFPQSIRSQPHATVTLGGLIALALAGSWIAAYATENGLGITYDSTVYVDAARHLAAGYGYTFNAGIQDVVPLTHFPPLYSLLLAALIKIARLTGHEFDACRVLGVLTFGANLATIGWIMIRWTRARLLPMVLTVGICALSFDLLRIHCTAWSECVFLLFTLVTLWFIARACATERARPLVLASVFTSLCILTRFAGLSVLFCGGICLLIWGGATWRRRVTRAAIYGAVAALPGAIWILRNLMVGGSAANRTIEFHAISLDVWIEAARTLARWWYPPAVSAALCVSLAAAVVAGFVILATYLGDRVRDDAESSAQATVDVIGPLDGVFTVFLVVYVAFLIFSITFVDHVTPLDWRLLSPVFVCGLMLQVAGMWRWLSRLRQHTWRPALRAAYVVALLGVLFMYGQKSLPWVRASSRGEDKGYNSPAWRRSGLIRWARHIPKKAVIYTNGSAALRYHAGRGAYVFPRDRQMPAGAEPVEDDAVGPNWRNRSNRGVMATSAIERMARHLGPNGYLIFFRIPPENTRDEKQIVRALKLGKPVHAGSDGNAYKMSVRSVPVKKSKHPPRKVPKPAAAASSPVTTSPATHPAAE